MAYPTCNTDEHGSRCKAVLLVNSKSRVGIEGFEETRRTLENDGFELVHAKVFATVNGLIRQAREATQAEVPLIIVGGGDGTINAVSGLIAHSKSTLAIIPLGTGNAFARDLRIPMNVAGACEVIKSGLPIDVDLGQIQNRFFVNVATMGLTTEIARELTNPMKKLYGRFAYAVALARGIRHLKPFRVFLDTENGLNEFECMQLVIGNGRLHAGPFPVLPDASLCAGKFSIYALKGNQRSELIKYALLLPGGHHAMLSQVHSEYAKAGRIRTVPAVNVIIDGEISGRTPVAFAAIPGALKVMAPADFDG